MIKLISLIFDDLTDFNDLTESTYLIEFLYKKATELPNLIALTDFIDFTGCSDFIVSDDLNNFTDVIVFIVFQLIFSDFKDFKDVQHFVTFVKVFKDLKNNYLIFKLKNKCCGHLHICILA